MADLFSTTGPARRNSGRAQKALEATYSYTDEAGNLLFEVLRFEGKQFRSRQPVGSGKWDWNLKGVRRVPYRLPELLASIAKGERVYVVEGEKDADRLASVGLCATTSPQGAGKWSPDFSPHFAGASVVVISDNDSPGRSHALSVVRSLTPFAARVAMLDLPDLVEKGDVSDWLDAGHSPEELSQLGDIALNAGPATPPPPEAPFALTDLGNAERLVRVFGDQIRHVPTSRHWFVWEGRRWQRDDTGQVIRFAKRTVRSIYAEASRTEDKAARAELVKWAQRSEAERQIRSMIELARSEESIAVRLTDFDAEPWSLNLLNGVLDLRSGVLAPHSPNRLITKIANASFDPGAEAPHWNSFLASILGSDASLMGFLQRAVGYALTGATEEQVMFILHGFGANGKSTLLEVVRSLLGDYATQADFNTFLKTKNDGPRNDIARLRGSRFVSSVEPSEGKGFAENVLKQMTGGDVITARFLYAEAFEFRPEFKLFLATNHKPPLRGTDAAIWRRIRLIPFTVSIPEDQQDKNLLPKLLGEADGILNWALLGLKAWRQEGLGMPAAIRDATEDYRREMDSLGGFLSERCEISPNHAVAASELYEAYLEWADLNGEEQMTQATFGRSLSERGFERVKRGTIHRTGLRLALRTEMDDLDGFLGNPNKQSGMHQHSR